MRHRRLALLLLLPLLLLGCWDRRDPEDVAWVTAVGMDRGPGGDYLFTFQVPGGGKQAQGGGQTGPGRSELDIFTVQAPDLVSALDASQSFVARRVSLMHVKAVIVGEAVARTDLTPILSTAVRFPDFRRSMAVLVSRGTARRFLELMQPTLEANPARWFELLSMTEDETETVTITRLHEFVMDTERGGLGAMATVVAPRPDIAQDEAEPEGDGALPIAVDVKAGEVRRSGEIPAEFIGMAVFRGAALAGYLTGQEARLVDLLRGQFTRGHFSFTDPVDPERRVMVLVLPRNPTRPRAAIRGKTVRASFSLELEGSLYKTGSALDPGVPRETALLEAHVEAELKRQMEALMRKVLHEWGIDPLGIYNELLPYFGTWAQWRAFNWEKRVSDTRFTVDVSFKLRRHGLQVGPPRKE